MKPNLKLRRLYFKLGTQIKKQNLLLKKKKKNFNTCATTAAIDIPRGRPRASTTLSPTFLGPSVSGPTRILLGFLEILIPFLEYDAAELQLLEDSNDALSETTVCFFFFIIFLLGGPSIVRLLDVS